MVALAAVAAAVAGLAVARAPRPPTRSAATRRSSCSTGGEPDLPAASVAGVRRRGAGCPPGRTRPTVYGRRAGRVASILDPVRAQRAGPRRAADRAPRGRLGDRSRCGCAAAGPSRRSTPPRHAPSAAAAAGVRRRRAAARSCSSRRDSHAAYFVPGLRDRPWPDPNDHADGRGRRIRPHLVRAAAVGRAGCAGPGTGARRRAGWVPGEMDSPRGPAFQPQGRWSDPDAWAAAAEPCRARRCDELGECDDRETAIAAVLAGLGTAGAGLVRPPAAAGRGGVTDGPAQAAARGPARRGALRR